jgi:hypothetical protein
MLSGHLDHIMKRIRKGRPRDVASGGEKKAVE